MSLLFIFAGSVRAADVITAMRRTNDERVAATFSGDLNTLGAIYSDGIIAGTCVQMPCTIINGTTLSFGLNGRF